MFFTHTHTQPGKLELKVPENFSQTVKLSTEVEKMAAFAPVPAMVKKSKENLRQFFPEEQTSFISKTMKV